MAKEPKRPSRKGGQKPEPQEGAFFSAETSETSGYKKPTDEDIVEHFHQARGNVCLAARRMGVSDRQVRTWVSKNPLLKKALTDARDHAEEWAVSKLFEAIDGVHMEGKKGTIYKRGPDTIALMFYLKCQHGWTDKPKGDGDDNAAELVKAFAAMFKQAEQKYDPPA